MEQNRRRSPSYQTGVSLVELMVGMTIGLFVTIVIIQVISVFEAQKRTTTGTADAQTNGSIALYTIERELQMAGYPLMPVTNSPLKCETLTVNGVADATVPNRLSPAAITDGGAAAGASDTITLRYGNSPMGGVPTQMNADVVPGNIAPVLNNFGCTQPIPTPNEIAIIVNGSTCAMTSVTALSAAGITPATITLQNTTAAVNGASLTCLGTWNEITYRANGGNLERSAVPSVVGIVNIQAQYGISTAVSSNQVVQWVNAKNLADWVVAVDGASTGVDWGNTMTVANRNRIKSIRIAVVARNAKIEPAVVTAACSSITVAAPTGLCAWDATSALPTPLVAPFVASPAPTIDLSNDPSWARYRYRVFETIIPLRNVIWARETL